MYTILLRDSKKLTITKKEAIVQYSNLCDKIQFLVAPVIDENNMTEFDTVLLEYLSPLTKLHRTEFLIRSEELYKGYLQYLLPVDTKITAEYGDLELQLTFYSTSMDTEGKVVRKVFKTLPCQVKVFPISNWSNCIPHESLTALDDRISKLLAMEQEITDAQGHIMNIIDDTTISDKKTYSSKKIEELFIDNNELDEALDSHEGIAYSEDMPTDSDSTSWFKIEGSNDSGDNPDSPDNPDEPDDPNNSDTGGIINDESVSKETTYSSDKIEADFIDNEELDTAVDKALDDYSEVAYSEDMPDNTNAKLFFKIEK